MVTGGIVFWGWIIEKVKSTPLRLEVEISFSNSLVEVNLSKSYNCFR